LKPSVLVFDTPPYTTQGVSLLEIHTEWARETLPKSGKAPFTFKPSLLADLSHTSSSLPSNRSDKLSTLGSTLQSTKGRRFSQPSQSSMLKRQTRIGDVASSKQESDTKLNSVDDIHSLRPPVEQSRLNGRAGSDSRLGLDYFQSVDEESASLDGDDSDTNIPAPVKPKLGSVSSAAEESADETLGNFNGKV